MGGEDAVMRTSGRATVEGRAKQRAKEIAERLKVRFQDEAWISQ